MKPLSGTRFAVTVGWRIAAFVAISFAFPAIVSAIQSVSECAETEGRCWVVAVLSGSVLRLALLGLLALSLVRPVWRRARTLGMPRLAGLLVPALLLLDWRFLTTLGSYWSILLDNGLLNSGLPFFTILALVIIVALVIDRRPSCSGDLLWKRRRVTCEAGWLTCAGAVVLGAVAAGLFVVWLSSLSTIGVISPYAADSLRLAKVAHSVALAAMVPFVWLILAETLSRPVRRQPQEPA